MIRTTLALNLAVICLALNTTTIMYAPAEMAKHQGHVRVKIDRFSRNTMNRHSSAPIIRVSKRQCMCCSALCICSLLTTANLSFNHTPITSSSFHPYHTNVPIKARSGILRVNSGETYSANANAHAFIPSPTDKKNN